MNWMASFLLTFRGENLLVGLSHSELQLNKRFFKSFTSFVFVKKYLLTFLNDSGIVSFDGYFLFRLIILHTSRLHVLCT